MKAEDMRAENRKRIVEGTIRCFFKSGIHETTTGMIAEESGVSLRTVTRCFPCKEDLVLEATITYLTLDLAQRKKQKDSSEYMNLSGLGQIHFILRKRAELMFENPRYYLIMNEIEVLIAERHLDQKTSNIYRTTILWIREEIELALQRGISDGTIRTGINQKQATDLLAGTYKGLLQRLTVQYFYPEAGVFRPREEIESFSAIADDYLTRP